ncbi:amino acid/polyamine/organocation transporter (APC superfamily) [Microbacteriaceae bacterium MWH-Ta3]|nr:amino acid/polyamine/organocation transporter (APC superfamily) [Microbacteriaceae bacterium MWH-Ta3]
MSDNGSAKAGLGDSEHLSVLGHGNTYHRSMSLWANLALGFTYLSPLVAIYAYFGLGLATAGPGSVFWILIVGAGQLLVALVMGEVVSQYPIAGGIYPWMRRLWGARSAWFAAWIYVWAMIVTITSVAEYGTGFLANVLGITEITPEITLTLALVLLVIALVLNLGGTKMLSRVARIGLMAELVGVVGLGLYFLIFQRKNDLSVFFDGFINGGEDYMTAFVGAAIVGLFMFYGFEACGDVAEEVSDAARQVPRAMYLTIFVGGISALMSYVGYVLAAPDLQKIIDDYNSGANYDPIGTILTAILGETGMRIFLVVAVMAFISCILSLQAAASRLLHSFARDHMLPGSAWLSKISPRSQVPTNALIVASVVPMALCVVIYVNPATLLPITMFAVLGIYIAFQSVVLAALRQRVKGWKPAGPFSLGQWGIVVNVAALAYGIWAIYTLMQPGVSGDFATDYVVHIGLATVIVVGTVYFLIARPDRKSTAPQGDALEVAAKIREAHAAK